MRVSKEEDMERLAKDRRLRLDVMGAKKKVGGRVVAAGSLISWATP